MGELESVEVDYAGCSGDSGAVESAVFVTESHIESSGTKK